MYPFYVLGVEERASDSEVEARYRELIKLSPPDRDPVRFRTIREAYEKIKDLRGRINICIFHPGDGPQVFTQELPDWFKTSRTPLSVDELREFLEKSRDG